MHVCIQFTRLSYEGQEQEYYDNAQVVIILNAYIHIRIRIRMHLCALV